MIRSVVILLFFTLVMSAHEVEMYEDYPEALAKAKAEERPLLIYLYMLNCKTCDYMNREVFTDSEVVTYLSENYVVVHLYTNDRTLPEPLRVELSPVFHFIDAQNGEMIESIMGGRHAGKFLELLRKSHTAYLEERK